MKFEAWVAGWCNWLGITDTTAISVATGVFAGGVLLAIAYAAVTIAFVIVAAIWTAFFKEA